MMYHLHRKMLADPPSQLRCGGLHVSHPNGKRCEASVQLIGSKGMKNCACGNPNTADPGGPRGIGNYHTTHGVAVAANELGGAMHNERGAKQKWLLEYRRGKRVVHEDWYAASLRSNRADIHEGGSGILWCFQHDQAGIGLDGGGYVLRFNPRHCASQQSAGEQVIRAAVQRPNTDYMLLLCFKRKENGSQCRHSGGERYALLAGFQLGHGLFKSANRGIVQSGVDGRS
jgi:hypothetical protein